MKQRPKMSGGINTIGYQHYSDSDDNDIDSIPLLPVRHTYINGERTSPSRRNNANTRQGTHNTFVNRVKQQPVLEAQVQETDTLQAIALRFHCSVEELKRLNNIHRENEIFAHSVLKIPLTPHSILLGALPKVHQLSGGNTPKITSPKNDNHNNVILNPVELNEKLLIVRPNDTTSDLCNVQNVVTVNEVIFNSTVTPSGRPVIELNDDVPPVINVKTLQPVLNLNGADCGVKWYHLLIIVLLLAFIVPLVYVLIIAEKELMEKNITLTKDH